MQEVALAYMDDTLKIDFPESSQVDIFKPLSSDNSLDFASFAEAYKNSDASSYLNSGNLLIVVNDAHRSTPTSLILKWFKKLSPKQFSSATFLVACGTHKLPSEKECITIFGDLYDEIKESLYFHDCHNADELKSIGKDTFGEEVFLNKKLFSHDKVWTINTVEPHYFAGYTGGRKSLVPGLADFKTIERNHNLANSLDCSPTKLQGNPMAEHLDSILDMIDQTNIISLQIVTDKENRISDLFFGSLKSSFEKAVKSASAVYVNKCSSLYDLLILEIATPLDRSIYQAQKALENCHAVVKEGGAVIICSACKDGIGSEHFYKLAENWDAKTNKPKNGKLTFGSHKLKRVIEIGKHINIFLKSTLADDIVIKLFYTPIEDVSGYVEHAFCKNEKLKIGVVYDAAHLVLIKEN